MKLEIPMIHRRKWRREGGKKGGRNEEKREEKGKHVASMELY